MSIGKTSAPDGFGALAWLDLVLDGNNLSSSRVCRTGTVEGAEQIPLLYTVTHPQFFCVLVMPRYMAPEVGLRKPYNLSADVYSWSMLMWYIMALEPPMGLFTPNMFIDRVFKKGCRPAVKSKWSPGLCNLMKSCWSKDISERPAFKSILLTLRAEATALDPELSHFLAGDAASRISEGVQSSTGAPSGSVKNGVAD